MSKDPAFLFYPGDYLRDTQNFTEHQQVAYDRIMCEHMRNICITQAQLNFFTKRLNPEEKKELMFYLKQVNGGFQIEWVAESIEKRRSYSDSRRENKTKNKHNICLSHDEHMENEIVNEIVIKKDSRFIKPTIEEVTSYCQERKNKVSPDVWLNHYESNGWMVGKNKMKDWKAAVRTWEKTNFESTPIKPVKQESPYEKCPRCGKELRKGYEYTIIGGQSCCEYCPEARVKAKQDYDKLQGMVNIKSL